LRAAAAGLLETIGIGKIGRHAALLAQRELWEVFLYLNERNVTKRPDAERVLLEPQHDLLAASIFAETYKLAASRGCIQAALLTDTKTYLVDDILAKVDRASMAVSLEARIPLLDVRVAEYALSLSERAKMGPWRQDRKRVLRALLGRYVPPALFERPKQGFSVPLARWFRGELRWLLDEYLGRERLIREGIFDAGVVGGLVQEHFSGRRDREAVLWALVFWEMWRERWGI
jgi:asparagine synthase (glutamine-hydrolysing)